jgi:hypothetical protein
MGGFVAQHPYFDAGGDTPPDFANRQTSLNQA